MNPIIPEEIICPCCGKAISLQVSRSRTESGGFVYIIEAAGYYKIGKANDVNKRMKQLSTGSPFALKLITSIPCDDPQTVEKTYHSRFRDKHVRGEWFQLTQEDITSITVETHHA